MLERNFTPEDVFDLIDEDDIRTAVMNSYKLSVEANQPRFDYNKIKDKGIRTRIRILTRMAFIGDHLPGH